MASIDRAAPLTPKQRLALSRRALVRQLNGGKEEPAHRDARIDPDDDLEYAHHDPIALGADDVRSQPSSRGHSRNVWSSMARGVAQRWWRRHPAHAMGQLARPLLEHYARKQPAKLMAAAAATGAVLVLVRPWRLLSVTAVLAAVLKTSDVADVVNTLMQKTQGQPHKDR